MILNRSQYRGGPFSKKSFTISLSHFCIVVGPGNNGVIISYHIVGPENVWSGSHCSSQASLVYSGREDLAGPKTLAQQIAQSILRVLFHSPEQLLSGPKNCVSGKVELAARPHSTSRFHSAYPDIGALGCDPLVTSMHSLEAHVLPDRSVTLAAAHTHSCKPKP